MAAPNLPKLHFQALEAALTEAKASAAYLEWALARPGAPVAPPTITSMRLYNLALAALEAKEKA